MTLAQDLLTTWLEPDTVARRGTVVVLPGRGESAAVYERLGRRLAGEAYRVHVTPAPTDSEEVARDAVRDAFADADPELPRILLGSDAGAAFAALLAARGDLDGVAALVLAGLPVSGAGAAPGADTAWDAELELRTACSTHRGRISAGAVVPAALFADLPEAWLDPAVAAAIAVPVLGLHGQDDAVSPVDAARRWYAAVPRAELVTVAGGRHDVLNDQTHRTVGATLTLFLERLRGGPDLTPIAVTERTPAGAEPLSEPDATIPGGPRS